MKVGIDVSPVIYGTGVSDYIQNLVSRLPPEILVLVGFSFRRGSEIRKIFPDSSVYPFPPLGLHYLWNRLHVVNFENFAPGKIDIYHSSDWAQAPDSSRKISTVHDLAPLLMPDQHSPLIVAVQKARLYWVERECDRIICVSENTQSDLHRLYPQTQKKTVVIPEALPARFLLTPVYTAQDPYLVAIGSRQPRKNIFRLISAFLKYQKPLRLPEKLIIVGENSSITNHKKVFFTGYISDQELVNYLANAACFVYPSLYEGFGLPVLEAFYHGVPVACSNTSSLPEVAGSAASYFDPAHEESLANGIALAIKNKKQLTKLGAIQLLKFSWQTTADETLKVYNSLL